MKGNAMEAIIVASTMIDDNTDASIIALLNNEFEYVGVKASGNASQVFSLLACSITSYIAKAGMTLDDFLPLMKEAIEESGLECARVEA